MEVISQLEGAFALLITNSHYPGEMMACKRGSPLVLGVRESSIQGVTNKADAAPMQPYKWGAGNALEVLLPAMSMRWWSILRGTTGTYSMHMV